MTADEQTRQILETNSRVKNSNEKYCEECAGIVSRRAEICPHCGVRLSMPPATQNLNLLGKNTQNGKNKYVAALLAFFLGGIGIHKFYLGQYGFGVLYLIFCWTFIPALISFVEFFIFLTMNDEVFEERYGRYDSL